MFKQPERLQDNLDTTRPQHKLLKIQTASEKEQMEKGRAWR